MLDTHPVTQALSLRRPTLLLLIYSTYTITVPLVHSVHCLDAYECVGDTIDFSVSEQHIFWGYRSGFGGTTQINATGSDGVFCAGDQSCHSADYIIPGDLVYAAGSQGCANTSIVLTEQALSRSVLMYGYQSMMNTTVTGNGKTAIECDGYESCAASYISATPWLIALGELALRNAVIHSQQNLTVSLLGRAAGYSATIYCTNGFSCTIVCSTVDACAALTCYGDCAFRGSTRNQPLLMPSLTVDNMDKSCTFDAANFDNYQQRNSSSLSIEALVSDQFLAGAEEAVVCCRADDACVYGGSLHFPSTINASLKCSGSGSCLGQTIVGTTGAVRCEAKWSCQQTRVVNVGSLLCLAEVSCAEAEVVSVSHILCAGFWSCANSTINYNNSDTIFVYLTGYQAGKNVDIACEEQAECVVVCAGYEACLSVELSCADSGLCSVVCDEEWSRCPMNGIELEPYTLVSAESLSTMPTSSPTEQPTSMPTELPTALPTTLGVQTNSTVYVVALTEHLSDAMETTTDTGSVAANEAHTYFVIAGMVIGFVSVVACCVYLYHVKVSQLRSMQDLEVNQANVNHAARSHARKAGEASCANVLEAAKTPKTEEEEEHSDMYIPGPDAQQTTTIGEAETSVDPDRR